MKEDLPKILIVDDVSNNLALLEASLSNYINVDFIKAESGEKALEAMGEHDLALAILDVDMPGMTGFELAELIHRKERTKHLPIIFLSAIFTNDFNISEGYTKGAVDYIIKPFNINSLLSKVRVFLDLFNQRKQLEKEVLRRSKIEAELRQMQAELEDRVKDRTMELSRTNETLQAEIAEREKAQQMLRVNEEKYRSMIESMNDMSYISNENHRIVFANPALMKQIGRDVTGELCHEVLHLKKTPCTWCSWDSIKKEKSAIITMQSPRDSRHYQVSNSLIHFDDGLYHKLAIFRDITAEKEVEENLTLAKRKAEQASQAKSVFLANMSHEMRTPLHHILNFSNFGIAKTGLLPIEEIREYFAIILESGSNLLNLLNDLLDLARLESGKVNFLMEKEELKDIISATIKEYSDALKEKSASIEFKKPEFSTDLVCSISHIKQVIRNLLSNAIRFTPEGEKIIVSIKPYELSTIAHTSSGKKVHALCITIKDHGIGIPEDELDTIFGKFNQSSNTITGAGGSGLGLSICREIILAHNGTINAKNNPEGGAQFSFVLPRIQEKQETPDYRVPAEAGGMKTLFDNS